MNKYNLIDLINVINAQLMNEADQMEVCLVSELHMHKILFVMYSNFNKKFHKDLFQANFEAWKYGPVEIDYRNKNKRDKFIVDLNSNELKYLKLLITNLLKSNPWVLVYMTHDLLSWIRNYNENNQHIKIPNEEIKRDFENAEYFNIEI